VEKKTIEKIYQKGSFKRMKEKVDEIKNLGSSNEEKIKRLEEVILTFKNSTNVYIRNSFKQLEPEIKELLEKLKSKSDSALNNVSSQPKSNLLRKEIIIPITLIGIFSLTGAIVIAKKK